RLRRRPRTIESGIAAPGNVPFGLRDFPVFDSHAHGHDRCFTALLDRSEVRPLPADGIEVTPLELTELRHRFPYARAKLDDDGILRLPEAGKQRSRGGIVLDDRP